MAREPELLLVRFVAAAVDEGAVGPMTEEEILDFPHRLKGKSSRRSAIYDLLQMCERVSRWSPHWARRARQIREMLEDSFPDDVPESARLRHAIPGVRADWRQLWDERYELVSARAEEEAAAELDHYEPLYPVAIELAEFDPPDEDRKGFHELYLEPEKKRRRPPA